jgi:TatD DNase family protein
MWPPDELNPHPLQHEGKPINHPANLRVSYELLAQVRGVEVEVLIEQIEQNYRRLFG